MPTGAILVVLITILGPISGAHFNPAVTLVFALQARIAGAAGRLLRGRPDRRAASPAPLLAHAMFDLPSVDFSMKARPGGAQWFAESSPTFGLVSTILGRPALPARTAMPWLVGLYITAAYWFTASTSFANPAVAIARASPTPSPASVR